MFKLEWFFNKKTKLAWVALVCVNSVVRYKIKTTIA